MFFVFLSNKKITIKLYQKIPISRVQGAVVQSIVSLTSSLRCQLIKGFMTF